MQFTNEELAEFVRAKLNAIKPERALRPELQVYAEMNRAVFEAALRELTREPAGMEIPLDVPESFTCPACGITTTRPNGEHYCHPTKRGN